MNFTKKEFQKICTITRYVERAIAEDDKKSKKLNTTPLYPMTTIYDKYADLSLELVKNPNSNLIMENLKYLRKLMNLEKNRIQKNSQKKEKEIQIIPQEIEQDIIGRNTLRTANEIQITPQEIEQDIIGRNTLRTANGKIVGIYGYFDTKKGIFIYIGKDSNICINLRDTQHYANDSQQINRILRNDKEGRYEYRVIDTMKYTSVLVLDILERYYIRLYNTYHYENSEGMNFTRGGETSFGIETEANINYDRVISKINRIYRGERDGMRMKERGIGKNGDTFVLTTNGTVSIKGKKFPKFIIRNRRTQGGITSNGDIRKVLNKFKDLNFEESELEIVERIKNEYEDILIEFGY